MYSVVPGILLWGAQNPLKGHCNLTELLTLSKGIVCSSTRFFMKAKGLLNWWFFFSFSCIILEMDLPLMSNNIWLFLHRISITSADSSLQLIGDKKRNKVNLARCIICQKDKQSENLTSTENERSNICAASTILQDDLLSDLDENDINAAKYHLKSCYKSHILLSKRSASHTR